MSKEVKAIKAGNQLIHQTIYNQAGSIQKALLEYIMNSVDAKASEIHIDLDLNGIDYSIKDNGNGFGDPNYTTEEKKKCIDEVFGHLGFDHGTDDENYRVYGKFGIGRAQLWAFSKNTWHTHNMTMDVDIKENGMAYEIEEVKEFFDGCLIKGQFYDQLAPNEILFIKKDLSKLSAFAPIKVFFNGVRINKDVSAIKSNLHVEHLHIELKETSSLRVYNQGVFVREYSNYMFGVGGVICSEIGHPFELNAARNDILQSRCKLWKKMKLALEKHLGTVSKKKKMTDDIRKTLLNKIAAGEYNIDNENYLKKPLLKMINNRYVSLEKLIKGQAFTIAPKKDDPVAEAIHHEGVHVVLLSEFTDEFGVSEEEFLNCLNEYKNNIYFNYRNNDIKYKYLEELKQNMNTNHVIIQQNKLTKRQKLFLEAINLESVHSPILPSSHSFENGIWQYENKKRKVLLGKSSTADAWTDGSSYICINEEVVKKTDRGAGHFLEIINLLIHEYKHDEDNAALHSLDFYKSYHDTTIHNAMGVYQSFEALIAAYTKRLTKNDFVIPKKLNRSMRKAEML